MITVVGIGGSTRPGSSTEVVVQAVLDRLAARGAETRMYAGPELALLPPYEQSEDCARASSALINDVRRADALVIGSPGYHGTISGLIKNALDHLEQLARDDPPYLDRKAVGCISTAYGWQGAAHTLSTLRQTVHAMRGWPTPYGIAINAIGGVTAPDGSCAEEHAAGIELMTSQIFEFARAMQRIAQPV
jgi:FMN reductase